VIPQTKRSLRGASVLLGLFLAGLPCLAPAVDTDDNPAAAALDPDYAAGKAAIEAKDWAVAIRRLSSAALRDTRNADIQNYLGYAYRNSGRMELAFRHYNRALQLNPRHRGAHEYVGEAWLMVGNLAKAEEHLNALSKICLIPCEELEDLEKKVREYRAHPRK
jgi:tetratricopeptide (TPR) repeat protein